MSSNATVLSYRFFNFHKKNQFLKIVQQKWFEVMSENQTVLSATTKGWMSGWITWTSNYSVDTKTENLVAYDLNIKKNLDEEDKKYINILAEYLAWEWEKYPWWWSLLFWYFLFYSIGLLLFTTLKLEKDSTLASILAIGFIPSWIIYYIYLFRKTKKKNEWIDQQYRARIKAYI